MARVSTAAVHGCFPIEAVGSSGRSRHVRIMTGAAARDGDVVDPEGMDVANYLRNPVVMWAHDYAGRTPAAGLPIGRTLRLDRSASGIDAEFEFLPDDEFARRVENAWDRGFLRAASIGWESLEAEPLGRGRGVRHRRTELLEWSLVPVPADPGASREIYAAGMRSLGFEDLLDGPAGAPREGVRHPAVHVLAQDLDDQWDYLRSRLEPRGAESPRLRRRLERIAAEIGETLGGEPGRVDGGDTADDDWGEALARAASAARELTG